MLAFTRMVLPDGRLLLRRVECKIPDECTAGWNTSSAFFTHLEKKPDVNYQLIRPCNESEAFQLETPNLTGLFLLPAPCSLQPHFQWAGPN